MEKGISFHLRESTLGSIKTQPAYHFPFKCISRPCHCRPPVVLYLIILGKLFQLYLPPAVFHETVIRGLLVQTNEHYRLSLSTILFNVLFKRARSICLFIIANAMSEKV